MTGITGGIGSGKSTIAKALIERGYTVYDCDKEAKRIIAENEEVRQAIIGLLGEESFVESTKSGLEGGKVYNTAFVAKQVFAKPELLEKLNRIVHPEVKKDILNKQPEFIESAILYEAGLADLCEKVIVVEAPEEVRIARTIARDYKGEATPDNIHKVRARIRCQQSAIRCQHSELSRQPSAISIQNDGKRSIDELAEEILNG